MTESTYAELVAEAITSGETVTVTRTDGKSATGKLAPHPTDPAFVKVVTGKRGRPFVFHPDDLDAVDFE
jgi:hypothetical protein